MGTGSGSFATTGLGGGVSLLGTAETTLLRAVDELVTAIAVDLGASEVIGPSLLPTDLLERLDYFVNFPHLGLVAAEFGPAAVRVLADGADVADVDGDGLLRSGYMLPSATCYGLLMSIGGQAIRGPVRVTASGRCFRNEDRYDGLRRLRGFHMREVLYVGDRDGAETHLRTWRVEIERLASKLGLSMECQPATDPFYDRQGSRSQLASLDPVKHEYVIADGTAIASVNRHRNFFGERLGIEIDGERAHSSCVAFGLERWVHGLVLAHGDPLAAVDRVRGA